MEVLIFIAVFTFIIGAIIGSFLNVVALRGLSGESIVFPSSHCTSCGNKLKPWHNIPILSYLFLRGKCAYCKEHISIQYPIVEFFTGLVMVACLFKFYPTITALFTFICCCGLIVMSVTDLKEQVICSGHAWFLIIAGIIYNIYLSFTQVAEFGNFEMNFHNILALPITGSIIGILASALVMELLAGVGKITVGKRAFGLGDTFIAAALGAFFGFKAFLIMLLLSVVVQVGIVIPGFFKKLAAKKDFNTMISLLLFFVAAAGFAYADNTGFIENIFVCLIATIVLLAIGIYTCFRVIKGMKEDSDLTILPFGPAMAIGAFVWLFCL